MGCALAVNALVAFKANAITDYVPAGFPDTTAANLQWTTDTATVTSTYKTTYISPGSTKWNGVSTKVNVVQGTSTSYNVRFVIATKKDDPASLGLTMPYCSAGSGDVCKNGGASTTYTAARIYLYEENMAAANFTTARRIACIAHELGHALSMTHVLAGSAVNLMNPILPADSTLSNLDKTNLKGRWGN
jgi:hypothetical protein